MANQLIALSADVPAIAASLDRLADNYAAGLDDRVVQGMSRLLEAGIRPSRIAQAIGVTEDVVWAMIGSDRRLAAAEIRGQRIEKSSIRAKISERLGEVVDGLADLAVAGERESTRVQAGEVFRKLALDAGLTGQEGGENQVQVAFEGEGRLAILLGGKKPVDNNG